MDIGIIFVRDLKLTSAKDPEDPQISWQEN